MVAQLQVKIGCTQTAYFEDANGNLVFGDREKKKNQYYLVTFATHCDLLQVKEWRIYDVNAHNVILGYRDFISSDYFSYYYRKMIAGIGQVKVSVEKQKNNSKEEQ